MMIIIIITIITIIITITINYTKESKHGKRESGKMNLKNKQNVCNSVSL